MVSILVLVDLILWRKHADIIITDDIGFNPCFGGSYIMTYPRSRLNSRTRYVSILVLVDLILWRLTRRSRQAQAAGFNPCFGGSYIMTHLENRIKPVETMFQSLFWWILYYDSTTFSHTLTKISVSILVLVDLILWPSGTKPAKFGKACFNPCFGGSYIMTYLIFRSYLASFCFNPCFGGSYIMTPDYDREQMIEQCFNPCFGGSYIMTTIAQAILETGWGFQSLFWWILYYDPSAWAKEAWEWTFQSLFWWILYYDCLISSSAFSIAAFQSLFWWILYYDPTMRHIDNVVGMFQSLFWWILYYDFGDVIRLSWEVVGFNPCFGGSYIMTSSPDLIPCS